MRVRLVSLAVALFGLSGAAHAPLGAQDLPHVAVLEVRPFAGAFVPVRAMRDEFRDAATFGAQGAIEVTRRLHLVGTLGYTPGRTRLGLADDRAHLWTYDGGLEANLTRAVGAAWKVRPFVGTGAGARSWDFRAARVTTHTCSVGYFTAGSELQRGALAWRIEARQYFSCFTSPLTEREHTRSDALFSLGAAWHIH